VKSLGLEGEVEIIHDFEEGLEKAEKENKPIFIDVTGIACVNCLTVDDRERLPENKWIQDIETEEYYKRVDQVSNYITRSPKVILTFGDHYVYVIISGCPSELFPTAPWHIPACRLPRQSHRQSPVRAWSRSHLPW